MQHGTLFTSKPEDRKEQSMLLEIFNFLQSWRRYNASLRELSHLGDRELADIGITRSDIPRIAWEDAHRLPRRSVQPDDSARFVRVLSFLLTAVLRAIPPRAC